MNRNQINGNKAKSLVAKGGVIVDVRDPVAFRDGSLPNAVNLSLRQLSLLQKYPKTTPIIVVGDRTDPSTLNAAMNYIEVYGFTKTFSLESVDAWDK